MTRAVQTSIFHRLPRGLLALIALVCLASVGGALVAQHVFDMLPCPWCIFQRVLYLGIAAVALISWATPSRTVTRATTAVVLLLALGGVASATFQHLVAAQDSSCAFTLADRFLNVTGLESAVPWLFQVTATCMDAAKARVLGLPFELWSGALFGLLAGFALLLLWHAKPRP